MAYAAWSVIAGEQPTAAKWNILGTNDASFNDGSGIGTSAISVSKVSFMVKSSADANGWIKRDYGNWQTYERTVNASSTVIAAQSNTSLGTFSVPVGITDTSSLRFFFGVLGGYSGRIYASADNGNTSSAVTSFSIQIGNLTSGSITFTGFVYCMAISV